MFGDRFEKEFDSSPIQLLSHVYPEHQWDPWKFDKSYGFWNDVTNQQAYLTWLAKQLDIQDPSDWYNVSRKVKINIYFVCVEFKDIIKWGGAGLISKVTLYELLQTKHPDYNWLPWKFEKCPKSYWTDNKNVRKYMDWAGKQLNVKDMSDWYNFKGKVFK